LTFPKKKRLKNITARNYYKYIHLHVGYFLFASKWILFPNSWWVWSCSWSLYPEYANFLVNSIYKLTCVYSHSNYEIRRKIQIKDIDDLTCLYNLLSDFRSSSAIHLSLELYYFAGPMPYTRVTLNV